MCSTAKPNDLIHLVTWWGTYDRHFHFAHLFRLTIPIILDWDILVEPGMVLDIRTAAIVKVCSAPSNSLPIHPLWSSFQWLCTWEVVFSPVHSRETPLAAPVLSTSIMPVIVVDSMLARTEEVIPQRKLVPLITFKQLLWDVKNQTEDLSSIIFYFSGPPLM